MFTKVRTKKVVVTCNCCGRKEEAEYLASIDIEDVSHMCDDCSQWFQREAQYEIPSLGY